MNIATAVLIGASLLLAGVLASKLSSRIGVPALLLFLVIGMLAGSEGPGRIPFDDPRTAALVGFVALFLILFDGGLQTHIRDLHRPVLVRGILLSTLGVGLTALIMGTAATVFVGVSWQQGLLIGAILSSTDAAAVFSVLRARGVGVSARLRSLIEFESASNDPTAVFLTVSVIALVQGTEVSPIALPALYVFRVAGGGIVGYIAGRLIAWLLDGIGLEYDGLYPVLTLACVGVAFGVAEILTTSGFMAAYIAGLTLSSRVFVHRASLIRFHDGLAWLMQIAMFLILGLLAFPSQLAAQARPALALSFVLMLVARPISVFVTMAFSDFTLREKLFVSWVGLRGAAPVILATFPLLAGLPGSEQVFSIVFFAVVVSVLVQGPTVGAAARMLGIAEPTTDDVSSPIEVNAPNAAGIAVRRLVVRPGSEADGAMLLQIGGPGLPLVVMIRREGRLSVPTGSTRLQAGDELFVLGEDDAMDVMRASVV